MAISSLFAKFKGLGPVIVVGGAVLVTIKLLTTQTPTTEESLIVKVEEDIKTDEYKDNIEIPEPEPEPEPEEQVQEPAPQDKGEDTEQGEEEKETEEAGEETEEDENEAEEEENDKEQSPPEPPKAPARKWATGKNDKVVGLLQKLLGNNQKQ